MQLTSSWPHTSEDANVRAFGTWTVMDTMSMADYEEALALVRAHQENALFAGPQSERVVLAAEAILGMTFPPTFRRFVRELGAGGIGSEEVYGIIGEDFTGPVPDGIWLTLKMRSDSKLPDTMVMIYDASESEYLVLDTSQTDSVGECPVKVWYPHWDKGDDQEIIAPDFGSFFLSVLSDGITSLEDDEESSGDE
jgi:antitoxin YobK